VTFFKIYFLPIFNHFHKFHPLRPLDSFFHNHFSPSLHKIAKLQKIMWGQTPLACPVRSRRAVLPGRKPSTYPLTRSNNFRTKKQKRRTLQCAPHCMSYCLTLHNHYITMHRPTVTRFEIYSLLIFSHLRNPDLFSLLTTFSTAKLSSHRTSFLTASPPWSPESYLVTPP
jgi:hypothetical protein